VCIILPGNDPVLLLVIGNTAGQTVNSCTSVFEGHLTDNQRDLTGCYLGSWGRWFSCTCLIQQVLYQLLQSGTLLSAWAWGDSTHFASLRGKTVRGEGGAVRKGLGQPRRRLAGPFLVKIGISLGHDSFCILWSHRCCLRWLLHIRCPVYAFLMVTSRRYWWVCLEYNCSWKRENHLIHSWATICWLSSLQGVVD